MIKKIIFSLRKWNVQLRYPPQQLWSCQEIQSSAVHNGSHNAVDSHTLQAKLNSAVNCADGEKFGTPPVNQSRLTVNDLLILHDLNIAGYRTTAHQEQIDIISKPLQQVLVISVIGNWLRKMNCPAFDSRNIGKTVIVPIRRHMHQRF